MKRKQPSLTVKLAAALCTLRRVENGKLVPIITHAEAKKLTAKQVVSKFHFDHGLAHALGGRAEHWNLTPRLIAEHMTKTATVDIPQISKAKRIAKKHRAHLDRMRGAERIGPIKVGNPMPGSRKSRYRRKMDGTVELRT